ncbi:MAG TPA: NAD-dependent epimerase/dehydratase family protein, partial [Gaiellaceae bacterium]|nr:NAD-dependent epimerase/dehydratase family protein [Gaiellaceae bacterium]
MLAFVEEEGRRVLGFRGVADRAVVVSSVDVYRAFGRLHRTERGPPDPTPLTEDSPLRDAVVDEAYDKVAVERATTSDPGFPVTILRYPAVHGPGDPHRRLYPYVRRMDDGRPAILLEDGHARWRWTRGYAEDVGHALALAVESEAGAGRIYNVAAPVAYAQEEWVRMIADVVGWRGRVVAVPSEVMPEALRLGVDFTQHYDVDSSRIRAELGYAEVVGERTALGRTVVWERENPPAEIQLDYLAEDAALAALG